MVDSASFLQFVFVFFPARRFLWRKGWAVWADDDLYVRKFFSPIILLQPKHGDRLSVRQRFWKFFRFSHLHLPPHHHFVLPNYGYVKALPPVEKRLSLRLYWHFSLCRCGNLNGTHFKCQLLQHSKKQHFLYGSVAPKPRAGCLHHCDDFNRACGWRNYRACSKPMPKKEEGRFLFEDYENIKK